MLVGQLQTSPVTIPERRGIVKNDDVENHYLCKENTMTAPAKKDLILSIFTTLLWGLPALYVLMVEVSPFVISFPTGRSIANLS